MRSLKKLLFNLLDYIVGNKSQLLHTVIIWKSEEIIFKKDESMVTIATKSKSFSS